MRGFDSRPGLNHDSRFLNHDNARVAELVYAHDLKSCLERDVGSIPTPGTDERSEYANGRKRGCASVWESKPD